jgi:rSAM/selenodomain-associated transferase 1
VNIQLLVIAKAPVPGRVKTRLCPPCTPAQAARIAAASLADTLQAVSSLGVRRTLVLEGSHPVPADWRVVPQRGGDLGDRLAHAFADTAEPGLATMLVGMDTPQLTSELLQKASTALAKGDAVLGPAADGGWWLLGLRDPRHAEALRGVPMSTSQTSDRTAEALRARGLGIAAAPVLRDVDTAMDALAVAQECPDGRFAAAVGEVLAG